MVLGHNVKEGERTRDIETSADVSFNSMMLSANTFKGLQKSGFYKPSPIQLHGIPLGKCGFDVLLEAKSGTGKTAVFTVIALEKLDLEKGLQTVILAPTREIAAQICDVIKQIGTFFTGLNVEVVMGGLPIEEDIMKFKKKVHILVGSPGRMRNLIQDKRIDISAVRLFVLDEADKLLDKSFQADINYIFSALPKLKQVIMSSATYPDTLKSLMQNYVQKAPHICPDSTSILLGIKQLVTTVKSNINIVKQTRNRYEELLRILSKQDFKQCLIFCNYQVRVGELCKMLTRDKWPAEQLHGQLDQSVRLDALKTLQEYKCRILVSTDLAARGIDASNVDLVINFEPPYEWHTYLHRIGRAGRFGSYGIAITIISEGKEQLKFKEMIKSINSPINLSYLWNETVFELEDVLSLENTKTKVENSKINKTSVVNEELNHQVKNKEISHQVKQKEVKQVQQAEENQVKKQDKIKKSLKKCDLEVEEMSKIMGDELLEFTKSPEIEDNVTCPDMLNTNEYKIESFEELIASYNSHTLTTNVTEDNEDVCDNNLSQYFDSAVNWETDLKAILESNSDIDHEKEESNNEADVEKEMEESNNYANVEKEDTSSPQHKSEITKKNSYSYNNDCNVPIQVNEVIGCSYQKALLDAGLPTAFGSKKYSQSKSLRSKESYTIKNQQLNNGKHNKSYNKHKYQQVTNSVKDTQWKTKPETSPNSLYDDGYNTQSCLLSKSTKSNLIKYKQCYSARSNERQHGSNDESYNYDVISNSDSYQEYTNWYKNLKSNVKQFEMSLFINELSKM